RAAVTRCLTVRRSRMPLPRTDRRLAPSQPGAPSEPRRVGSIVSPTTSQGRPPVPQITLTVDGAERRVEAPVTGLDLFGDRREVVVVRVNGELVDLSAALPAGAAVEGVTIGSPDGLAVLRHSTAHVLAQAVQELHPHARLGIGPPIT